MIEAAKKLRQDCGFTFLELLFVFIVVAVFVAAAVPRVGKTFERLTLENFVKELYLLSYYLRESAASDGKLYFLQMSVEQGAFSAGYRDGEDFKNLTGHRSFYQAPEKVGVFVEPAETARVYFYPDGATDAAILIFKNRHQDERKLSFGGSSGGIKIE